MGLDTFARRADQSDLTPEDVAAFEKEDINLCGGVFSGNGNDGSFRGKVYNEFVENVTGQSLYQEWIEPEVVKQMYEAFADYVLNDPNEEPRSLMLFLKVCAERNLGLVGWW